MVNFAHIAPQDRWPLIEATLNQMLAEKQNASTISPTATVNVEELASQSNVSTDTMLKTLNKGGAMPFRMGKVWMVREINLLTFYQNAERHATKARA